MASTDYLWHETAPPSLVNTEFMVSWVENNGDLFAKKWRAFYDKYSADYDITVKGRHGYINLIASLKVSA